MLSCETPPPSHRWDSSSPPARVLLGGRLRGGSAARGLPAHSQHLQEASPWLGTLGTSLGDWAPWKRRTEPGLAPRGSTAAKQTLARKLGTTTSPSPDVLPAHQSPPG